MKLTLPVPPSANLYWRDRVQRLGDGRHIVQRYKTGEARQYQVLVSQTALAAGYRPVKLPQPVVIRVTWFREAKRGDLDNRLKVLLDAIQGTVYENDSQVVEIHAYREEDKARPRVELEVGVIRSMRL